MVSLVSNPEQGDYSFQYKVSRQSHLTSKLSKLSEAASKKPYKWEAKKLLVIGHYDTHLKLSINY